MQTKGAKKVGRFSIQFEVANDKEQIEILQDNRPNKCGTALGFDRRRVRSLASQDFEVNALHSIPLGGSSVGIAHLDFTAALQTKLLYG